MTPTPAPPDYGSRAVHSPPSGLCLAYGDEEPEGVMEQTISQRHDIFGISLIHLQVVHSCYQDLPRNTIAGYLGKML